MESYFRAGFPYITVNLDKSDYAAIGLFVFMLGVTFHGFTQIDGDMAVHFDSDGEPDRSTDKVEGLVLLPVISLGLFLLLKFIPRIDPLGKNVEEFRPALKWLAVFTVGFLGYIQTVIVAWNLGFVFDVSKAVVPAIAAMFYALGLLFERAERNWFVGLRTPWTLSSDDVWRRTHEKTAPLLKFSAVFVLGALAFPEFMVYFVAVPAGAVALFSTVYSYKLYSEEED